MLKTARSKIFFFCLKKEKKTTFKVSTPDFPFYFSHHLEEPLSLSFDIIPSLLPDKLDNLHLIFHVFMFLFYITFSSSPAYLPKSQSYNKLF